VRVRCVRVPKDKQHLCVHSTKAVLVSIDTRVCKQVCAYTSALGGHGPQQLYLYVQVTPLNTYTTPSHTHIRPHMHTHTYAHTHTHTHNHTRATYTHKHTHKYTNNTQCMEMVDKAEGGQGGRWTSKAWVPWSICALLSRCAMSPDSLRGHTCADASDLC